MDNTGERMAVIETKVDNIEVHLKQQSTTLGKIESKLDDSIREHQSIMNCKADKKDLKVIWSVLYSTVGGLIIILFSIIGYLLTQILF